MSAVENLAGFVSVFCFLKVELNVCRFEYNAAAEVVKEIQFEEVEG